MNDLLHVSEAVLSGLKQNISENLPKYQSEGFREESANIDWCIRVKDVAIDLGALSTLDGSSNSASADIDNTLIVMEAMNGLNPTLAREERIWVRLSHLECFNYTCERWFSSGDFNEKSIKLHFFASSREVAQRRHSISRLWWAGHIAKQCMPDSPEIAVRLLFRRADVFQSFMEKPYFVPRLKLAQSVLRIMNEDTRALESEQSYRDFMTVINRKGGGVFFEAMSESQVDDFAFQALEESAHLVPSR